MCDIVINGITIKPKRRVKMNEKIIYKIYSPDEVTEQLSDIINKRALVASSCRNGYYIIARYGVNRRALAKILKEFLIEHNEGS